MRKSRSVWVSGCASTAASDGSALAMRFWRSATSRVLSATKVLAEWRTAGSSATGATVATHLSVLKTRLSDQRARALITRPTTAMMTRMSASQRRSRGARCDVRTFLTGRRAPMTAVTAPPEAAGSAATVISSAGPAATAVIASAGPAATRVASAASLAASAGRAAACRFFGAALGRRLPCGFGASLSGIETPSVDRAGHHTRCGCESVRCLHSAWSRVGRPKVREGCGPAAGRAAGPRVSGRPRRLSRRRRGP